MVNQYRIGRSLGRGAYASVELAVDVGTGKEYVSQSGRSPLTPGDQGVFQVAITLSIAAGKAQTGHEGTDHEGTREIYEGIDQQAG
jgi:hypothetical protein